MTDACSLTVCIPSNRSHELSRLSIQSAMDFVATREGAKVVVSDNSGDSKKFDFYAPIANSKFSCEFQTDSSVDNWGVVLNASGSDYSQVLADDDYLYSIGNPLCYERHDELVGYQPNFAIWRKEKGILSYKSFGIDGNTAPERVKQYFKSNGGSNTSLYSALRADLWRTISSLARQHPLRAAGYYDWAVTLSFCASGKLLQDPSSLYVYDSHQWDGPAEFVQEQIGGLFAKTFVGRAFSRYHHLLLSVDSFIFILASTRHLSPNERLEAAATALASYLSHFARFFNSHSALFSRQERQDILELLRLTDLQKILTAILVCFHRVDPRLALEYEAFYRVGVEKRWGDF